MMAFNSTCETTLHATNRSGLIITGIINCGLTEFGKLPHHQLDSSRSYCITNLMAISEFWNYKVNYMYMYIHTEGKYETSNVHYQLTKTRNMKLEQIQAFKYTLYRTVIKSPTVNEIWILMLTFSPVANTRVINPLSVTFVSLFVK